MLAATIRTAWFLVPLASASALADESGYRAKLSGGPTLDTWVVTGCDVGVEDGVIRLRGGDGFVRTLERHGDFELQLDWRALRESNYDSGIYVRADLPPEGKPWPTRYQINLKQGGEGNLLGLSGAQSKGLIKPGEWNHFKITVRGNTAALEINGQPAWKASGLENADGYIGLQSEVDGGGQFEFKNIELVDLDFKPLFNGRDTAGWTGGTNDYEIKDGSLVSLPLGRRNLYTEAEYGDFSFRFSFKLTPGANNGVGIRAPLTGDSAYQGMEIQILDDSSERYKSIQPYQAHGSIYGIVPAKPGALKPVGEWNHEEIIARGRHVTVILNGKTIVDADLDEATKDGTLDHKDHPGLKRDRGHIGFLGHGARIEFRDMRIKELK